MDELQDLIAFQYPYIRIKLPELLDEILFASGRDEHPHLTFFPDNDTIQRQSIAESRKDSGLQSLYFGNGYLLFGKEAATEQQHSVSRNYVICIEKHMQYEGTAYDRPDNRRHVLVQYGDYA